MSKSKETPNKKKSDEIANNLNNLPWGLPLAFPSMSSFGSFPTLGLPPTNFPMLNSFPSLAFNSLLNTESNNSNSTVHPWSNGLTNFDYNEYSKQLGLLMNAFHEQKSPQIDQSNGKSLHSSSDKSSKSKRINPGNQSCSSSSDCVPGKTSLAQTKKVDESHPHSSSISNSTRVPSPANLKKSSRSKHLNNQPKSSSNNSESNVLDSMSFTSNTSSITNPTFPYFLSPLLSQTSSTPTGTNNNLSSMTYPFSNLSSSLLNPAASLYPFLSNDWFSSPTSKLIENYSNFSSNKNQDGKDQISQAKNLEKNSSNESKTKKRSKPSRNSSEEQKNSSITDQNGVSQSIDENRSNDDDDSDPNPKRKKIEEVNEALVRLPFASGWKRITIIRALTRTGVRGDVSYLAPCGRKLRSFQEIDRYLTKKKLTNLDRSNFTFSSKVHIGHFHEPKETTDGKVVFEEFTDEQIIRRVLEINPKFRPIRNDFESENSNGNGFQSFPFFDELRTEPKKKIETNQHSFSHNSFLQAIIEQQKQDFEHQQKLQLEQKEQERKRQELNYLKQVELKKRQEEKNLLVEQRKAEKLAQREKKIQEKYTQIVYAKERKRIVEDMQLKDLKDLPILTKIENSRLSSEAFANGLLVIEFVNNFKETLGIAEEFLPTLNSFQQWTSRDVNGLCQVLLRLALEDPGIPNPKKNLTILGQKLSEIEITERTFSEILRLYIRERNGFEDKISQILSDFSFQSLNLDEKIEILAFLCHDLSTNKRIVEETDRRLDELIVLKHEKLEIDKRLRRLKFDKANLNNGNNVKKLAVLIREKDLNSSENESPDESDPESIKIESGENFSMLDENELETLDLEKKISFYTQKYNEIKRRVVLKQIRIRSFQLGQDRFRRRYWFFSQVPGIFVEGLRSGDPSADEIKESIEFAAKQRSEKKFDVNSTENSNLTRSTNRKKSSNKSNQNIFVHRTKTENEQEKISPENCSNVDRSTFCFSSKEEENSPLDLSCSKEKKILQENLIEPTKQNPMKFIEQTIREKFQFDAPRPIPIEFENGWWQIQTVDEFRSLMKSLARRGQRERFLCRNLQRFSSIFLGSISDAPSIENETEDDRRASSSNDETHENEILKEIFTFAERIIAAKLQNSTFDEKNFRLKSNRENFNLKNSEIVDEAKILLTEIERNIDRRYLKPPFARKCDFNLSTSSRIQQNESNEFFHENFGSNDEVPHQLDRWRRAVADSRTPAQLALCLTQLERCVAWERSTIKVYCEICNEDGNEEKLLLCDACDHGTHTYCFNPPLNSIPPNDWFCFVCIGKRNGENLCFVCGSNGNDSLVHCDQCGKEFHSFCLKNAKQQRGKWFCLLCSSNVDSPSTNNESTINSRSRSNSNRKSKIFNDEEKTSICSSQENFLESNKKKTRSTRFSKELVNSR